MRKTIQSLVLFMALGLASYAQGHTFDPLQAPNSYQSVDNPYYWKNKSPIDGYWQQDVHYHIKAKVDDQTDIISGELKLVYWNNSPDTLHEVYFHLYQNAFQPGSYYHHLQMANDNPPSYGAHEAAGLGTEIGEITVNGYQAELVLDNTVLKVILPQPMEPKESVTFEMTFDTYFDGKGDVRRRMKTYNSYGFKHYDGVHWYPRIACYDRKFGWTTDQHLGKEFYGDFGTYDVELTFANDFIVGATGNLTNREKVLPTELRESLKIENFKDKPWRSAPNEIIPRTDVLKTWKYHAENVHDFAFTADPLYRIGEAEWDGIKCYSLVQEPHAARWQDAASYSAKVIEIYSRDIGRYGYHKMIVADANDGMEYPMLTLDGGKSPDYKGLLAHEIGHNWFFGMIGSNETYRAYMDEGFTQFLTAWAQENIDGDTIRYTANQSKYINNHTAPVLVRPRVAYRGYIYDVNWGNDHPLNTHSHEFGNALGHGGGYRLVYYKTAVMLYNLQYVLGDELFLAAMQNYFAQWSMAHPYPEDMRNSFIRYTGVDLNWFFDQWLETTKHIDYKVKSVEGRALKSDSLKGLHKYHIVLERKGNFQMPIDFQIRTDSGNYDYHIPNNWFVKKTDAQVLPKWHGTGSLLDEYIVDITLPHLIKEVVIDPSERLGDVNLLNNSTIPAISYQLDSGIDNFPDHKTYEVKARPSIWYNGFDGIKAGLHIEGDHLDLYHNFEADFWLNFRTLQHQRFKEVTRGLIAPVSGQIHYSTPFTRPHKNGWFVADLRALDGLYAYKLGGRLISEKTNGHLDVYFKSMFRESAMDLDYLLYSDQWASGLWNNTLNAEYQRKFSSTHGFTDVKANIKASGPGSDYSYGLLNVSAITHRTMGRFNFRTRTFAQYGTGTNWAKESMLFAAGANPEEMMDNKYTRSTGFFHPDWTGSYNGQIGHFQYGGGLNLRGYNGYGLPEYNSDSVLVLGYRSGTGLSYSAELDAANWIRMVPSRVSRYLDLQPYLFFDAGVIDLRPNSSIVDLSNVRMDAGPGLLLTVRKWGVLETPRPLTIRFDMPVLLNRYPYGDDGFFALRWLVGIKRSF